jgi:hypothetical protein
LNPTQKGLLTVLSGGQIVAKIHMVGDYTTANFTLNADSSGHLQITDPPTVGQQPSHIASVAEGAHTTIPLIGVVTAIDGDAGALIVNPYPAHLG